MRDTLNNSSKIQVLHSTFSFSNSLDTLEYQNWPRRRKNQNDGNLFNSFLSLTHNHIMKTDNDDKLKTIFFLIFTVALSAALSDDPDSALKTTISTTTTTSTFSTTGDVTPPREFPINDSIGADTLPPKEFPEDQSRVNETAVKILLNNSTDDANNTKIDNKSSTEVKSCRVGQVLTNLNDFLSFDFLFHVVER